MKLFFKTFIIGSCLLFSNIILSQTPTDCVDAVITCGNSNISLDVRGIGNQELSGSNTCSSQENNSIWLKATIVTGGTLGFTLTPNSRDIEEDYDFFIFGPNVTCGSLGQAIRCSTTNPLAAGSSNNLTGLRSTESDTAEGPGADGNNFVRSLDVNPGDIYFIVIDRPIGVSPFSLEWTGTAEFAEPPSDQSASSGGSSGTSKNLEQCDDIVPFDDGFVDFDLSVNTAAIIGTQTDVTLTYHDSPSDANIGINPLPNTYRNIRNPQTIYVRMTDDNTGCFELTDFQLDVNLGPNFVEPTDYILCDNLDDGNDKNGRVIFDLSSKNNEILGGQNPADFSVRYYTSRANAESNTSALPNLYYNTTPFNEQVVARIEDVTNTNCRSFTTLNLVVNTAPDSFNATLIQCDEDGLPDGLTIFNLTEANDILTAGIANRSIKFYIDATRTNEIMESDSNAFENTISSQIIYVEVINDTSGCLSLAELALDVTATDANNAFITVCDNDGVEDGLHIFDLNDANNDILNGFPTTLNIVYYASFNDSIIEENPINTTFTNTNPFSQIVYARVENDNDCFGISQVFLNVLPLPDIKTEDIVYYCLNDFPNVITIDAALLNNSPSNYSYSWSTGDTTYETQINTPGIYTVNVTDNNSNNCSKLRTVTVEASNIASFQTPPFDINDLMENNSITVFVTGEGTYQYSLVDQNDNTVKPYQDSNIFENVFPGIYTVFVNDIKNNCGVVDQKVSVIGFPKFFTPNGDGVHDTWQISGVTEMFQPNSKIQIFNRYGKLLKQLDPLEEGFNGTLNGVELPTDDYWFSIVLQDGRIFKGHFALIN